MAEAGNLYPYPSTLNIANFVTVKLSDSSNYSLWKTQMLCLLESQELVGFIDGTLIQTPLLENPDNYLKWKRSDRLVKGWILGSLTEDMLEYVFEKVSARDVWLELKDICCVISLDNFEEGSTMQPIIDEAESVESKEDYKYCLPLYRASLCGDWEKAKTFLKKDNEASRAQITSFSQTALHIAVTSKNDNAKFFVENLVALMADDALAIRDSFGETPLHYAARFGNLDAAKILVNRNSNLPHIASKNGLYPIHLAAEYGYKSVDLVHYFFSITDDLAPYTGRTGVRLLYRLICSDLYDFATHLVKCFPDLAKYSTSNGSSPLAQLATKTSAFVGTSHISSPKPLSYMVTSATSWIFQERANANDIENAVNEALLNKPKTNSPELEYIRDKEWKYQNAIKLAECFCEKLECLSEKEMKSIVGGPFLQAVRFDNYKLVEIIVGKFPLLVYHCNRNGKNILHIAVENRCTNVFNFVCQMTQHRHHLMTSLDSFNNTMLHLAGKLSPENKVNHTFGAALRMQEELRWFEAVKQMLPPSYYERLNNKGKTAHQVFIEQHANLKIEGEKWMKEIANSCAILAMLAITIAFAAAITVPGGRNCENGLPIFSRNGFYSAFAFSNTVSISTACISLFAFISILTSSYAEEDFLHVLPKRLLWGLLTLYASVEAMILSFGCALYFVFKDNYMVFYVGFVLAVLPILAFQHWRGPLVNHLFLVVKKKTILWRHRSRGSTMILEA
ncbi:PREDICTED: protein ACCELERATED CELL DEATH 6-like isoform X2 [Nicotiana attenuata]|uniref:PGG domain-containing protein n=1 Tax=Nicotiana attenuata TaxID=49451 RepID=A0A314LFI0_NICAT|nr:PREDICTED: protein ACCELERATED CELL DEATH 6-like isoform X2 [Nicotiana attenuata]OIT40322.1 hypothetical protein A4A49_21561 [Nicotiana attenuata]